MRRPDGNAVKRALKISTRDLLLLLPYEDSDGVQNSSLLVKAGHLGSSSGGVLFGEPLHELDSWNY
jgi:hypothetical protein